MIKMKLLPGNISIPYLLAIFGGHVPNTPNINFLVARPLLITVLLIIGSNILANENDGFELYAKVHLSIDMADDNQEKSVSLSNNSSRFGLQGKHSINNETAFLWRMEQKVYMDESGGRFGSTSLKVSC